MENTAIPGHIEVIPAGGPNFDHTFQSMRPSPKFGEDLRAFNLADGTGVVVQVGYDTCSLSNKNIRALRDLLNAYLEST